MTIAIDVLLTPCFHRLHPLSTSLRVLILFLGRLFLRLVLLLGLCFAITINTFFYCFFFGLFIVPEWIWTYISKNGPRPEEKGDGHELEIAVDGYFDIEKVSICRTDEISELELDPNCVDGEGEPDVFVETEPRVRTWLGCIESDGEAVDVNATLG